jgi:hypothetical protein
MYRPRPLRASAALLASLIVGARGDCDCYGLDYTNGGSYLIDGNSETKFSFTSQFEGTCPSSRRSRFGIGSLHTKQAPALMPQSCQSSSPLRDMATSAHPSSPISIT